MSKSIYVDVGDATKLLDQLNDYYNPKQMNRLLRRVFVRTGQKVKTIVSTDVPKYYHIKKRRVAQDIMPPSFDAGSSDGNPSCVVSIIGTRHIIGGNTFPAKGGRHGWHGIKAGKRYKITTQILQGKTSTLPEQIADQGGHPPFRNFSAKKLNNAAFTRHANAGFPPNNLPIARVVGIAVPQMPLNLAEKDVQDDIASFLMARIVHENDWMLKEIAKKNGA